MDRRESLFAILSFLGLPYIFFYCQPTKPFYLNLILLVSASFCITAWWVKRKKPHWFEMQPLQSKNNEFPYNALEWVVAYLKDFLNYASEGWSVLIFSLVALTRLFHFGLNLIPSGSMIPNFIEGDRVLLRKDVFGYRLPWDETKGIFGKKPQRGEIVCFYPPKKQSNYDHGKSAEYGSELYVKRIIGLPGDTIKITANSLEVTPAGETKAKRAIWKLPQVDSEGVKRQAANSTQPILITETLLNLSYPIQFSKVPGQTFQEPKEWHVPEGHYFMLGDNRNNSADSRVFGCVPEKLIVAKPVLILFNKPQGGSFFSHFKLSRFLHPIATPQPVAEVTEPVEDEQEQGGSQ